MAYDTVVVDTYRGWSSLLLTMDSLFEGSTSDYDDDDDDDDYYNQEQ